MLNMHVYNFKKAVPQVTICAPPLMSFTIAHCIERFLLYSCMFCLLMFVYHVSVEPEGVRSPGTRVKGSCKLLFEPKPSARTNAINAEELLQPFKPHKLTQPSLFRHGKPALPSVSPLLDYGTSPTLCLILAQQSLNLNPSFLAPHLITTLSSLNLLGLPTRPLVTGSVC